MFLHNHARLPHISYVNSVFLHEVFGLILALASLVEDGGKPAILNGVFADSVKPRTGQPWWSATRDLLTMIWLFHCLPDSALAAASWAEFAEQLGKIVEFQT